MTMTEVVFSAENPCVREVELTVHTDFKAGSCHHLNSVFLSSLVQVRGGKIADFLSLLF